jgi:hypothetical protein
VTNTTTTAFYFSLALETQSTSMSVFHGNWNEDPKDFLHSYLQCTAAGGDSFRARQFINYLGVYSEADDWFDELPHEEKKNWAAIEFSFRKRWFREDSEVLSINDTVTGTTENEPQLKPTLTPATATPSASTVNTSTQTNTTTSRQPKIGPTSTGVTTSQSLAAAPFEIGYPTNEFSTNFTVFSSPTLSITALNQEACFTSTLGPQMRSTTAAFAQKVEKVEETYIFTQTNSPNTPILDDTSSIITSTSSLALTTFDTACETRPETAAFMEKQQKIEKSLIFTKTFPQPPSPSTFEPTNEVRRTYTSSGTPNDDLLQPLTLKSTASSLQHPPNTGHEKSVLLCAVFESQAPRESTEHTTIVPALKTRSETADFAKNRNKHEKTPIFTRKPPEPTISVSKTSSVTSSNSAAPSPTPTAFKTQPTTPSFTKNHSKVEKAPIFAQKAPEPLILEHSNRENDAGLVPAPYILPTKHPCNFSGLYFRNLSILIHFDLNPTSINIPLSVSFSSSFTWPLFQPPFTVLSIILFKKSYFPFPSSKDLDSLLQLDQFHFYFYYLWLLFPWVTISGATRASPCLRGAHGVVAFGHSPALT